MKKILIAFLALVTALSCFAFIGCENKVEDAQKNEDRQATLDMYIFDKDGQTISEDFVLPGKIGKFDATWTSNNAIIALEELAGDEENGIERQYVAKVGLPEERTEINLTVALSEEVTKSFTVYVNSLSVYDFSGSYNFIQNNGTVFTSFALDTTCEYKDHTATITWSVDEEYADYLEISEDGKECIVYPSSLNPKVRINATFTYKGESTTKSYRMTVSEQKESLQEVDYWYTNTGVGIVMSGYVVSVATVYSESYANVSLYMVNDEFTAGYYLYRVKADSQNAALIAPGVHITVTGTTNTDYNGLMETNAGGTLVVDADVPSININEAVYAVDNDVIGNLQSAYYNQSRLVSLTNWKVKEIKSTPDLSSGTQTLFVLTKAGVDVPVVISKYQEGAYAYSTDNATCAALIALQGTLKVGDIVSVTGILGNYKGHQIAPLSAEAVVVGGTADAEGTVYAGQKAAKAVAAIDKLIADNGLNSIVAVAKNVQLPATVEGCEVSFRVIGEPRSISIVDGALVINPGKMERACLTAAITVDGFTTNIFRYIDAADLDDAGKVELEEKELTFVTDEAINADTVLTVPVVGNLFNNVTISWASNNECAVVDGSTITVTVPEEIVEVIFTATITLNNAVLTKEFVVEVGKPANISLVDFVALASALENKAATTKKYIVSGIVTEVANTTYGNLYITDAAGNTLYVYGCYDADGANRYDAMATAPQVGDYVTLFGVASNYNGPQMKNAWVQTCVNPTTVVEAIAIADKLEHNTTTTEKYLVTGTITEVYNTTYGNMYITDAEGNVLTIYGTYSEDGSLRYDAIGEAAPKAGDVVTVYGVASKYNTTCQLKNAWIVLVTAGNHEHDFTGEWKSNASKHWHECVCGEIVDEADHVYVSGVCECGAKEPVAGSVVLTVDSLSIPSQTYATGTATVNGVSFEFVQLGNYGTGLQMRDNPEKGTTLLWNTSALGTGISKIELVYHSSKTTYNNDDAIIFSFGNAVDSLTSITNFSTVAGTYNYTVTPDAGTYTFFKLEYDYDKSAYWASITIYFEGDSGEVTPPVECEHVWTDATCTAPKTCSKCGETEGEALGHTFVEGVCSVCGAKDPNYVAPGEKVFGIINAPVAGTAYKFGMVQEKKNDGKVYYLTGAMSGYYMATTTDETAALDVYLEETTGGYYLYAMINGAKTYINMVVSGTHVNGAYQAAASTVYRYDAESKTVIAVVNDTDYWFGTRNDNTYTTVGPCAVSYKGFYCKFYGWIEGETPVECEHSWVDATCTAPKTCSKCGATEGEKAAHTWVDATCTAPKTCSACKATEGEALGHTFVEGVCSVCGAKDPNYVAPDHQHSFTILKGDSQTANHWYECACGEASEEVIAHVDTNLDITCDYEGCTKRILPAADTKVSLFTANHMRIVSLTSNYYVEGVVTLVDDAKNGIFVITDEAGDSLTIKLPKNAEGTAYSSWTSGKVVLGDTIQVYGQPKTTTSSTLAPKAMIQGGVLTVLKHEHVFSEPTCTEDGVCGCLAVGTPALGHADEDKDGYCDRCQWNMKLVLTTLNTHNDPATGTNPVLDEAKTFWTWSNDEFDITLSKGTSTYTLYTSVKAYMQIKTNNVTTITNKTGALISTITMKATNTSYLGYLKSNFAESDIIVDETALTLTINWNSSENFSFVNTNSQSIRIESVTIAYEPKEEAPVECAHEWTGMDSNEKGHWLVCTLCQATGEVSEHTERVINNGETHARECSHCGYVIAAEEAHVYTDGTCACGAQEPAEVVVLTVAEFIEICNTYAHNTYSNDKYYVAGVITSVTNTQYGNMTIKDATGEVLIYGTYNADGSEGYSAMADKPVVGHTITVYTIAGTYSNAPQGKNGWIVEHTPSHTCVYSTEWNSDANNHWNSCVYCAVANEESRVAHTFADGKCNVCGMVDPSTSAFSLTKVTSMDQLVEGAVIVLTYNDKFTMGAISGKYFSSVAFSKTATKVDSNWVTLTLEKSASGNWVLKTKDGKYVASNGNGNYAQAAASVTNIAEWTITLSNGKLKIQNVALTDRYLQYNASSPRFACYKTTSNQADPEAYIVSGI